MTVSMLLHLFAACAPAPETDSSAVDTAACDVSELCDGTCRDLTSDGDHCGACGNVCGSDEVCFNGECGVPASLPEAKVGAGVTADDQGRIYALGGLTDYSVTASAWRFDPSSNAWEALDSLPVARALAMAAVDGLGRVCAVGGIGTSGQPLADAWCLDADGWTEIAPPSEARLMGGAGFLEAHGLCVFGGTGASAGSTSLECYDAQANAWTSLAELEQGRLGIGGTTTADGQLLAVGGYPSSTQTEPQATVELFDGEAWATAEPVFTGRYEPAAAVDAFGRVIVAGGHEPQALSTVASAEIFENGQWSPIAEMTQVRAAMDAASDHHGRVYVVGGHGTTTSIELSTIDIWDPSRGIWVGSE